MKKFNIFLIIYFISFLILLIINAILESSKGYSIIIVYYPYLYYIAVVLMIIKGWELLTKVMNIFSNSSLGVILLKLVVFGISAFVTFCIVVMMLFYGGAAYSEKLGDKEYIVVERGAFAVVMQHYHERHNLFLMKKKESYSHKI